MKRVNVFFSDECLKELDSVLKKAKESKKIGGWWMSFSRGDLIRFALDYTFGIEFPLVHITRDSFVDILKDMKLIKGK